MNTKSLPTTKQLETVHLLNHSFNQKNFLENLFSDTVYDDAFRAHMKVHQLNTEFFASNECNRKLNLERLNAAVCEADKHSSTLHALIHRVKRSTTESLSLGSEKKQRFQT